MNGQHPNVHQAWNAWSEDQTLHVVSTYFNPFRFENRRRLFHDFAYHMEHTPNVVHWPVEVAFGARPFEVTQADNPQHTQLRTNDVLWYKENCLNIGVQRIVLARPEAQYMAYFDADITCSRHDWALEAIHQLQHYSWVQLFSSFVFHSPDGRPIHQHPGYAYIYNEYEPDPAEQQPKWSEARMAVAPKAVPKVSNYHNLMAKPGPMQRPGKRNLRWPGAPGLGWAFTREGFDAVGGFLDTCIMGSADWHQALGMTGDEARGASVVDKHGSGDAYNQSIGLWQRRAFAAIKGKIGYVPQQLIHHWHGDHSNRQYQTRWEILDRNKFDPAMDLRRDAQGLLHYTGNKPQLERDMNRYVLDRNDDSPEMQGRPML